MSSFSTLALSMLISLFFASISNSEGSIFSPPRVTVNITNVLKSHNQLIVHCKSGDDDLGIHRLPSLISYAFSFRPNIFGKTLFFCSFQWPNSFHFFEIYKDSRDKWLCDLCMWIVGEKSICMFNGGTKKYDICYAWPPK